ncbi:MAG TPA: matrixin family metalloprotease [Planctomycetes bacterium]|nr:matrixin family metalloprotease [Planctomycetota bacterium]HIK62368.1 matrixin family metalloprotease [Planctomycetota bacterium]
MFKISPFHRAFSWAVRAGLPTGAAILALGLLLPARSEGFMVFGDRLDLSQRDFRIWNNFSDPEANSNQIPDPDFPGALGAELAIWKGVAEWGSGPHGSGRTDPTQDTIGSGASNFDAFYSGLAGGPGNTNGNVISQIPGSLFIKAYTEIPIRDGWRIRFYQNPWVWNDTPDGVLAGGPDAWDLQGVACHEFGHALGLDHSAVPGSTMFGSSPAGGVALRSIEADDIAGVQSIYGVRSATKVQIDGYEFIPGGIRIRGSGFHPTNNQIWFTHAAPTIGSDGTPVRVMGVPSGGGGTRVFVAPPALAGPGDLMVRRPGRDPEDLSNAFPFDPNSVLLAPPLTYGSGKVSSAGILASLDWGSLPSQTAGTFELSCSTGIIGGTPAILFSGPQRTSLPALGGTLLVARPLAREQVLQLDFFGAADISVPVPAGMVGVTRYYQLWFKDPGSSFGSGLTNAVQVTFLP